MRQWPVTLGHGAPDDRVEHDYFEPTTEGLAARCAEAAASWGTGTSDKTAARLEPSQLYKDPEAHPLVLMLVVLDRYGAEVFDWDPEVLRVTMIRDQYQVSGANWAKLMAMRTLLMSPSPWRQWEVLHWCARALCGLAPNFTYLEEPVLSHLAATLDVMKIVDPKRDTTVEIDKFVAATFRHDGHVYAPPPLDFAQAELEERRLHCKRCGAEFPDNNDAKCIPCGSTELERVPYPWAVLREHVKKEFTTRTHLPIDRALDGLGEDPVGNLTYELLVQWDHGKRLRQKLVEQLRALSR